MDVVEVVLSWGATVLAVEQVRAGRGISLGEQGDLVLPSEIVGADRVEILRYDRDDVATAFVPPGASLRVGGRPVAAESCELARGQVAEIEVGSFVVRRARVRAERRIPGAGVGNLQESGAGFIAGSALFHAAVFTAIAFFAPSLGATEEDPFDADRLALLQRMLDASAQREHDNPPTEATAPSGGDVNAGAPAAGAEGASGRPDTTKSGRWAAKGDARPENATLAREHALAEADSFAAIGVLASAFVSDPSAPVVPWGTTLNGSDAVSKVGLLFGRSIDDGFGTGGLGTSGIEQGGGGNANAIGLNGMGGLGHTGTCTGDGPCDGGIGNGHGRVPGGHASHFKGPRYATPTVNGRLAAEVIQRIVRLNDGRYRNCYEAALRSNPSLEGRVTVKFMIDRTGAVSIAADGGSDIPDEGVRRCVVSSFLSLSFPAPENGAVSVVYPIVFNPE
jgi:hypothetical protein